MADLEIITSSDRPEIGEQATGAFRQVYDGALASAVAGHENSVPAGTDGELRPLDPR